MTTSNKFLAGILAGSLASPLASAAEGDEQILKVKKSTFVNLVDLLVQRGVLKQEEGKGLVKAAEDEAAEVEKLQEKAVPAQTAEAPAAESGAGKKPGKSLHVSYVPEIVKKEIREQVRAELRADVAKDVQAKAREEKWGIPAALPDWVSRIRPYFDMRIRLADEFYNDRNAVALDWLAINEEGGLNQAYAKNKAFLNNRMDRLRLRERFRVGFDAQITDHLKGGFRFATSNIYNPVSNDQTLGNTGQSYQFAIDRAFLQYDFVDGKGRDWFSIYGGRFPNIFVSTDVVYDQDLSLEGLAGTFRWRFNQSDPAVKNYKAPEPTARLGVNQGTQTPDSLFATVGVFPLEEVNLSSSDKWMFGGQLGADWLVAGDQRLIVAASYYDFHNIRARRNSLNSRRFDWTAPQFIQKGNSLVSINDGGNQSDCADNICRVGLASDFSVFNATATYDYGGFAPTHVLFTADYAKNLGFNQRRIAREFGTIVEPKTNAFQLRVDVGHPELHRFNDWNIYLAYRYVERDAVLDAFTDSVFHQGGTNAKGWVAGVQYGLARNTWVNLRWFSTGSISRSDDMAAGTGKRFDIDTVNLDLNARF